MSKVILTSSSETFHAANSTFEFKKAELIKLLPQGAEIEHVGATSIPGCLTKGDLDICVRVQAKDFSEADGKLAAYYERNVASDRHDYFSAFKDEKVQPPLGIQLVVKGSSLDCFIQFRDILQSNPILLSEYNSLKRNAAQKSLEDYRSMKSEFIKYVLGQ